MVNGYQPVSLQEALNIKAEHRVTIYGGGTDLMVGKDKPDTYLFVNLIPEMKNIIEDQDYIRIGAAATFTEVLENSLTSQILKDAISLIAAPAIRNLGTMGGNIGNGSAKADSVLIHYAADAKLRLASVRGERIVNIDAFYLGRKKLDLAEDELIVEILLPKNGLDNYYYQKVGGRKALAISKVAFVGIFGMEGDRISKLSIAFGAVADTVLRFKEIEAIMIGKTLEEAKAQKQVFLDAYEKAIVPISGRVSSEYRKETCLNLLNDFLQQNHI
ncbi:FAD binding domain-containing protein [Anaerocolumna sp.]|uniref:FAD binding domain-containing protein n=1 Tax=Anaerocolumna sp. TaxID=2041569 RepID=UPI0028AED2FA|nr:FAD binding domain-containing protein [Anaerocolumna sp.]